MWLNNNIAPAENLNDQRAFVVVRHHKDILRVLRTGTSISHITGIVKLSSSSSSLDVTRFFIFDRSIGSFFQSALEHYYWCQLNEHSTNINIRVTCRRLDGCLVLGFVKGIVLGVEVLFVFVLRTSGLSDTGVSSESGVSGSWNWGMELPLIGVFSPLSPAPASFFFCMTRMGVLSTTTSPPSTQPGDLGSISAMVLTGVSHAVASVAAADPESTAIGVLSTPSLAERGSVNTK